MTRHTTLHQNKIIIFNILLLFLFGSVLFAQQQQAKTQPDSTLKAVEKDSVKTPAPVVYEEQILETIRIDAVVEKPSVTLIPKRAETDVGQIPFGNRSFDKELKAKPAFLSGYGKELETVKKIKKLKKLLAKEKK